MQGVRDTKDSWAQLNPPGGGEEDKAATTIQRAWRKRASQVVPYSSFEAAKAIMSAPGWTDTIPQAEPGFAYVGLPDGLDIVIKGDDPFIPLGFCAATRQREKREARETLERIGAVQIIVPRDREHMGYLVEDRVPFVSYKEDDQILLYRENLEGFTQTAIEFVTFLLHSNTSDLANNKVPEKKGIIARYDNAPLYVVDGRGMLALLDLENYSQSSVDQPVGRVEAVMTALRFFPSHTEEILKRAFELSPVLESDKEYLERVAAEALEVHEFIHNKLGKGGR